MLATIIPAHNYIELLCDGCGRRFAYGLADDEQQAQLIRELVEDSEQSGWTTQAQAHWCPGCTIQRVPGDECSTAQMPIAEQSKQL